MDEFRCRTKNIQGVEYFITIMNEDGTARAQIGTFETLEAAKHMTAALPPDVVAEIRETHWTREVCIECGQEVF